MKKVRLTAIATIAVISSIAIAKAAVQTAPAIDADSETWVYTGSTTSGENTPSEYVPLSEAPSTTCDGSQNLVCEIIASDNGGVPDLSAGNPRTNQSAYSTTFRTH